MVRRFCVQRMSFETCSGLNRETEEPSGGLRGPSLSPSRAEGFEE